ncbi:DUF5994 family protein [Nonomuraea basaltis]|uniref:DUF5994 family protein n=1 Tax=Nonomuraea basaltis TaxID=2495887 RepID=UPI00110C6D30|nr:DUF5994 family protein [Nonomuraea basaltis]TMR95678.1 hypothetical protein EJK15_27100 [Nonomuraea basaltis]
MSPVLDERATVDGAWWPYSNDATAELPGLIAAVDQRLSRTTLRVGVYRDTWNHIPHRIPARGRQVQVGCFRHADRHVIVLILAGAEPIVLLVIPPSTARARAEAALTLTDQVTTGFAPSGIIARLPVIPGAGAAEEDGSLVWENEGGHSAAAHPIDQPTVPA